MKFVHKEHVYDMASSAEIGEIETRGAYGDGCSDPRVPMEVIRLYRAPNGVLWATRSIVERRHMRRGALWFYLSSGETGERVSEERDFEPIFGENSDALIRAMARLWAKPAAVHDLVARAFIP